MPKRRGWGEGSVRKRRGAWWIRVPDGRGRQREIRTQAESKPEAITVLNNHLGRLRSNPELQGVLRVTVADLYDDLKRDYRTRGRKSEIANRWAHLEPVFGNLKAAAVTAQRVRDYAAGRLRDGAEIATVNREIACLRRMIRLGVQDGRVMRQPTFSTLAGENVRGGFLEPGEFDKLLAELPRPLDLMALLAFWTGMRRGEILGLRWADVSLKSGEVRLQGRATKTGVARSFIMPAPALDALRQWRDEMKAAGVACPHVVNRHGKPVKDFYIAWRSACQRAGRPGLLLHDLRRSAARNYVRAGVSERVARDILGHRTRSIFDRYNITSDSDLRDAAERVVARLRAE